MKLWHAWVAAMVVLAAAVFAFAPVFTAPSVAARPQFVPGKRVVIEVGQFTSEGTVVSVH
ncbi:hypothetical protein EXS62_01900 [Candidatus Kaiserbacteria bacterium]|nr:hypothetical protein [Candidatus Kaiserbacteria bacterium]